MAKLDPAKEIYVYQNVNKRFQFDIPRSFLPFGYPMAILYCRPRSGGYMGWAKSLFNTTLAISNLRAHNVAATLRSCTKYRQFSAYAVFWTLEKQLGKQKAV